MNEELYKQAIQSIQDGCITYIPIEDGKLSVSTTSSQIIHRLAGDNLFMSKHLRLIDTQVARELINPRLFDIAELL